MNLFNQFFETNDVFIIAEIGKNFIQTEEEQSVETYLENAKALIDSAVDSGVDAVKFQTHNYEDEQLNVHIKSPHFSSSDRYSWVKRNTNSTPLFFWEKLEKYCSSKGILFFSTPMSRNAARKISHLVPFWKVGSGDVQDYLLLNELIKTKKQIIISTGMVSLSELDKLVKYFYKNNSQVCILYCVSKYPCSKEEFNLSTINFLKEKYTNSIIGFSDHSMGYSSSLAAVRFGARVIEKHFSLDRNLWGSDHKVSMEPKEMKEMVDAIRSKVFEKNDYRGFYGDIEKELEGANNEFRPFFEKKIVAAEDLPKGTNLTE